MAEIFDSSKVADKIVADADKAMHGDHSASQALLDEVAALKPSQLRLLDYQFKWLNNHSGDYPYTFTVENSCHQITGLQFVRSLGEKSSLSVDLTRTAGYPNPERPCALEP